jgi:hypothetical protein
MFDRRTSEMGLQQSGFRRKLEPIKQVVVIQRVLGPYTMQRFLHLHSSWTCPNSASPWLTTFADNQVTRLQAVTRFFMRLESHFSQVVQIKLPPSNIAVAQIGQWRALVLFGVKHLAKAGINMIA